jgi:transcriptional regulator with XRE-family HTH domain
VLVNFKLALAARERHAVDVALQVGVDPTLLSQIINERRKAGAELRTRLAAALKADEEWLFSTSTLVPGLNRTGTAIAVSRLTAEDGDEH